MKIRVWVALVAALLCLGGAAQAQDFTGGSDGVRKGCPGFFFCYQRCRSEYDRATDSCEWIDWTGFGAYCQAQAAYQFSLCSEDCYLQCQS
jgi:hypothetical protein